MQLLMKLPMQKYKEIRTHTSNSAENQTNPAEWSSLALLCVPRLNCGLPGQGLQKNLNQSQLLPTSLVPAFQESSSNTISHHISSPAMVSNISAFVLSLHIIFSHTHRTWPASPVFCNVMRFSFVISTNQYWERLGKERCWMSRAHSSRLFKLRFYYLKQN